MDNALRITFFSGGLLCLLAASSIKGVSGAGWEVALVDNAWVRVFISALGLGFVTVVAWDVWTVRRDARRDAELAWQDAQELEAARIAGTNDAFPTDTRPSTVTYIVRSPWNRVHQFEAASYDESSDGKHWTFTDRDGRPVKTLPKEDVTDIDVVTPPQFSSFDPPPF